MPRVTRFEELPVWLQSDLRQDWKNLCFPKAPPDDPPIRDPEYRVYQLDKNLGWWVVDAGTGGVIVQREGESHNYSDLPEGPLKELIDLHGKETRDQDNIERLYSVILSYGEDPRSVGAMVKWMTMADMPPINTIRALHAYLDGVLKRQLA